MNKMNPTVAALDRYARRLGIELREPGGVNARELRWNATRVIRYRPGGKGVVRCEAIESGCTDSIVYRTQPQMETLFESLLVRMAD